MSLVGGAAVCAPLLTASVALLPGLAQPFPTQPGCPNPRAAHMCSLLTCAHRSSSSASQQVSPVLRILITRSVALVPALAVAIVTRNSAESTAMDTLNQWLNLVSGWLAGLVAERCAGICMVLQG